MKNLAPPIAFLTGLGLAFLYFNHAIAEEPPTLQPKFRNPSHEEGASSQRKASGHTDSLSPQELGGQKGQKLCDADKWMQSISEFTDEQVLDFHNAIIGVKAGKPKNRAPKSMVELSKKAPAIQGSSKKGGMESLKLQIRANLESFENDPERCSDVQEVLSSIK